MTRGDLFWPALIGAGVAYEVAALRMDRDADTLSHRTRAWAHVHHPAGRAAFAVGWTALYGWYMIHIMRKEKA